MSTAQEELRGILSELVGGEITKVAAAIQALSATTGESQAKILSNMEKYESRLGEIEGMVREKRGFFPLGNTAGAGDGGLYYGYDLRKQGVDNIDRLSHLKAMNALPAHVIIPDDAARERTAKWCVDLIRATVLGDVEGMIAMQEWKRKAALVEGTAANGGYLVPDEFESQILAFSRLQSVALPRVRMWDMGTDVKRIPAENAAPSVTWIAENGAVQESEPTVTEVVLTAKKVGAYSIASSEMLTDSTTDIVSWLTELFAEAIGQEIDNQVFNGTGSPCSGILLGASVSTVLGTGRSNFSSVHPDDLSLLISKIAANKKMGAEFFFHREVLHYLFTLKETAGAYIYGMPGSQYPTKIWGYPWVECEKLPAMSATAASTPFGVFGNLRHFAMGRKVNSMSLFVDPYGLLTTDQVRFRMLNRWALSIAQASALGRVVTAS